MLSEDFSLDDHRCDGCGRVVPDLSACFYCGHDSLEEEDNPNNKEKTTTWL